MKRTTLVQLIWIALCASGLVWLASRTGIASLNHWCVPVILLFFFFVYEYDIRLKGIGNLNLDHVIAFPAVVILQNPLAVGLLAGAGLIASRVYRKGLKGIQLLTLWGAVLVATAISLGCYFYLSLSPRPPGDALEPFLLLLLAMAVMTVLNWLGFLLGSPPVRRDGLGALLWKPFLNNMLWVVLSSPFVALVVGASWEQRYLYTLLGALTLFVLIWAMRLYARLEDRNKALIGATGRQEFLQQLSLAGAGSLEDEPFLRRLMEGLRDFVHWDRDLMLVHPPGGGSGPVLISSTGGADDKDAARDSLMAMLVDPALRKPALKRDGQFVPILMADAASQITVAMATTELAFAVLVVERANSNGEFSDGDASFLDLSLAQIARHVQDDILKKQLLATNRKLVRQTDYLSQILQISNLLKVHLDVHTILEKVAQGIRTGMGFGCVLISIYDQDGRCFERTAQAGMDERWEAIRAVKPPDKDILELLQEKYRMGNCYFISHKEARTTPYDILPLNQESRKGPDGWDPMDTLLIPLRDKDDRLLGIISVDEPKDGKMPTVETLRALEVLANQTVNALESARIHARTRRQAVMDGLTGLFNHGYFQESLALQAREHVESGQPYTLLMIDLDNFKEINDTFGHLAGDEVLKAVANTLNACIRKEDIAARYGGEEFAVLLPRCPKDQADVIAERIRSTVSEMDVKVESVEGSIHVTLSVGLASFPSEGGDHQRILEKADHALYIAKRQGKNRVCQAR